MKKTTNTTTTTGEGKRKNYKYPTLPDRNTTPSIEDAKTLMGVIMHGIYKEFNDDTQNDHNLRKYMTAIADRVEKHYSFNYHIGVKRHVYMGAPAHLDMYSKELRGLSYEEKQVALHNDRIRPYYGYYIDLNVVDAGVNYTLRMYTCITKTDAYTTFGKPVRYEVFKDLIIFEEL